MVDVGRDNIKRRVEVGHVLRDGKLSVCSVASNSGGVEACWACTRQTSTAADEGDAEDFKSSG